MSCARRAEPAHAVREPGRREPHLRIAQALAELAQDLGGRYAAALEHHGGMAAREAGIDGIDDAFDADAGYVHVGEEHRRAATLAFDARHHDREAGAFGPGDEPLAAIDHVVIAFQARRGLEQRRVGARTGAGLGHAKAGANLAAGQRHQPALLVLLGRHRFEQMHVAFVGCGAIQCQRPEHRVARLFEHHRAADVREPEAAVRGADMRRQQAGATRQRVELAPQLVARPVRGQPRVLLERNDLLAHELGGSCAQGKVFGAECEVNHRGSWWFLVVKWRGRARRRG